MTLILQTAFSALLITFSAWLSKRSPQAAGFLIALPLATLIVLPFSYWQHGDGESSVKLAKEILRALPVSVTFFLPFAFAQKFQLNFWQAYGIGVFLLIASYFSIQLIQR